MVFFDDIIIYSRTWQEHIEHIRIILHLLQDQQLFTDRNKCSFGQTELEYLGHIITSKGVLIDPKKIEAIVNWPTLKNMTRVRGFLGVTGFVCKFIKGYAHIATPLTDLTKKDAFKWAQMVESAFQQLKVAMTSTSVLTMLDFSKPFTIECDASGFGIGAVFLQEERPIAYKS